MERPDKSPNREEIVRYICQALDLAADANAEVVLRPRPATWPTERRLIIYLSEWLENPGANLDMLKATLQTDKEVSE